MYDVITIGGATLDIFLDIHEASAHCKVVKDEGGEWFALKRGEKIPVDALHYDVGGNAANVAVGLSRLGIQTATYLHYGNDEISQKIVTTLQNEGVSTEFTVQDSHETSPIGIAINFQGERTLFVHHIVRDHALPQISVPKWIYLTSVGERWEDLYRQIVDFATSNNVKFAFNPGSHQLESGVGAFIKQVQTANVLFVNKEEALKIANFRFPSVNNEQKEVKTLLSQLQQIGPNIVSITDGSNGSYAIEPGGAMYHIEKFPAPVLERTGAGDSYAAGFLAAIVLGKNVAEAMQWGAINAAAVIGTIGAEKGLLKREEIAAKLLQHANFKAAQLA